MVVDLFYIFLFFKENSDCGSVFIFILSSLHCPQEGNQKSNSNDKTASDKNNDYRHGISPFRIASIRVESVVNNTIVMELAGINIAAIMGVKDPCKAK